MSERTALDDVVVSDEARRRANVVRDRIIREACESVGLYVYRAIHSQVVPALARRECASCSFFEESPNGCGCTYCRNPERESSETLAGGCALWEGEVPKETEDEEWFDEGPPLNAKCDRCGGIGITRWDAFVHGLASFFDFWSVLPEPKCKKCRGTGK